MRARFPYSDYSANRIPGGFGYILFFLPLLLCPQSRYGRFCANQGLLGLLAIVLIKISDWILDLIVGWIPLAGTLVGLVLSLGRVAVSLLMLYYAFLAIFCDDERELPIIGRYDILH